MSDGIEIKMENVVNGCYKLSWRERIGFCSGDLAQNLIYQTVTKRSCDKIEELKN